MCVWYLKTFCPALFKMAQPDGNSFHLLHDLSEDFRHRTSGYLLENSTPQPSGCRFWTAACDSHGYGVCRCPGRLPDGSVNKRVKAHRLSKSIAVGKWLDFDLHPMDVSHLCHMPKCIKPEHLSIEPRQINRSRACCRQEGLCMRDHWPFPPCFPPL